MKKILFIITICLLPFAGTNAQQTEKSTKDYLPKAGDWAIGIDVVPVLKYVGNAFNGNRNNEIEHLGGAPFTKGDDRFTLIPDVSIMGKYMLTDEWAVRVNLGLMIRSENERRYVIDDKELVLNPLSENKVIDKAHYNRNGMSLAVGGEYRKGNRRVQGVFGFGALFAFQSDNTSYTWGNEITNINQTPSSSFNQFYATNYRTLKDNSDGSHFYTGLTGSAGVEWFICPKISLGAEVNLTAYYLFGTQTYRESEGYNESIGRVETKTDILSPGDRGFYFGTQSLGGSLNMTFYF